MMRFNLSFNNVNASLIWHINNFYLKNPKKWTSLKHLKLINAL